MTGTSLDGLDLALVGLEGSGMAMRVVSMRHAHVPLGELQGRLRAACTESLTAEGWTSLAHDLGQLHAEAIANTWPGESIDLVAAHGQTLFHAPPHSMQLLNAWPIAQAIGCPVVSDLRGADLAAGGQGAPITPIADVILYREHLPEDGLAIVNLGGFANATILHPAKLDAPVGFDCCPCNHLLDAAARHLLDQPFDPDGRHAAAGTPRQPMAQSLAETISTLQHEHRSGGTGDEGLDHLRAVYESMSSASIEDTLATVADAIGQAVAASLEPHGIRQACLAGGGARNAGLESAIGRHLGTPPKQSGEFGVPIDAREAAAMAILGTLAADGHPITTPASTGRGDLRIRAGSWVCTDT